jgi:hypothetical protein
MLDSILSGHGVWCKSKHRGVPAQRMKFGKLTTEARSLIDSFVSEQESPFKLRDVQSLLLSKLSLAVSLPLLRRYLREVKCLRYKKVKQQLRRTNLS